MKTINKNIIVLADQAIFSSGSFVITLFLAKYLGIERFGLYATLTLINYSVVALLNAIVVQPLQVSLERIENKRSYLSFNLYAQLILVLISALILLLLLQFNSHYLRAIQKIGYAIIYYLVGFVMQDYLRKIFLAQSKIWEAIIIDLLTTIGNLFVIAILYKNPSFKLQDVILYLSLAYIPGLIFGLQQIKPHFRSLNEYVKYINLHVNQGKWLLITTFTQWWASNLFIVSSGLFLGVKTLGAFRLVQSLFGLLNILLQTFENYALPEATRILVYSRENARTYLKKMGLKSALLFGSILLLLFNFSEETILLFGGKEYQNYSFIIQGMCILYAIIFIGYPIRIAIRMLLLNKVFFVGYLLSLIFSLLSYNFLLQHWNISGALAGLIISQLILLCYWQYILYKNRFILWK